MASDKYLGFDETELNKDVPTERCDHMALFLDGRIVVLGGKFQRVQDSMEDSLANNVIWTYRLDNFRWEKFVIPSGQKLPAATKYASLTTVGRDIYLLGGSVWTDTFLQITNSFWKLSRTDQHGFEWTEVITEDNSKAPSPRATSRRMGICR